MRHLFLIAAFLLNTQACHAQQRAVTELQGRITLENFVTFEKFIAANLNKVIGLQVTVDKSGDNDILQASDSEFDSQTRQVAIYVRNNQGSEIVATGGYSFQRGAYVFDGFYIVKSGGVHQGTVSYGLVRADETVVRLSGTKLRRVKLPQR